MMVMSWCDGVMVRRNVSMETKPTPEFHRIPRVCVACFDRHGKFLFSLLASSSSSLYFPEQEKGTRD